MEMAADKAVNEMSWEDIDFLFRPSNQLELWLRLDFEGTKEKIGQFISDDSPGAMPHRFRHQYIPVLNRTIEIEVFYRQMKSLQDQKK